MQACGITFETEELIRLGHGSGGKLTDEIVSMLKDNPLGRGASIIGRITAEHKGRVVARTVVEGRLIVDKLAGDQLPRIC